MRSFTLGVTSFIHNGLGKRWRSYSNNFSSIHAQFRRSVNMLVQRPKCNLKMKMLKILEHLFELVTTRHQRPGFQDALAVPFLKFVPK